MSQQEAAAHTYLPALDSVVERAIVYSTENDVLEIPLICLPECIIFPNETLPLRLRDRHLIQYFTSAMTRPDFAGLLGVWNYLIPYTRREHVGITAAIRT